jgi:hypothetical protein
MVVVLSSHAVSTGFSYHHIMIGSVLLSSTAEGKCTKLNNTIMHYVRRTYPLKMMWASTQICFLSVRLLIGKPVACFKSAIFVGNCGCQFPWCALALNVVPLPSYRNYCGSLTLRQITELQLLLAGIMPWNVGREIPLIMKIYAFIV